MSIEVTMALAAVVVGLLAGGLLGVVEIVRDYRHRTRVSMVGELLRRDLAERLEFAMRWQPAATGRHHLVETGRHHLRG